MLEIIEKATQENAEGLLLVIGSEPMIKKQNSWLPFSDRLVKHSDWSHLVNSFLPGYLQIELEKRGQSSVWGKKFNREMTLSFYQNEDMSKAVIDFVPVGESIQRENFAPPSVFADILMRERGLSLLVGARDSLNSLLLHSMLQELNTKRSCHVVVISSEVFPPIERKKAHIVTMNLPCWQAAKQNNCVHGADIVIFNGIQDVELITEAIKMAETGMNVLFSFPANSVQNAIRQIYSALPQVSYRHYVHRFTEVFTGILCRSKMRGIAGESIFGNEVLMNKPSIRTWIENESMDKLKDYLLQFNEVPGVLSLNQNLLQLIIRRKIDIKTAFKWTHEPDHLDQLMKKVGI